MLKTILTPSMPQKITLTSILLLLLIAVPWRTSIAYPQRLSLSSTAIQESTTYIVQAGDTLNKIARRFNVTVQQIADANDLTNVNLIFVGQRLIIPTNEPTPQPTSPIDSVARNAANPQYRLRCQPQNQRLNRRGPIRTS